MRPDGSAARAATHEIPARMLTDLATGAGGPAAVRTLAGIRRSRTLVLLRAVRDLAAATGHPEAAPTAAAFEALARVHRSAPAAAERLLAAPMVGAWAMSTVRSLAVGDNDAAEPGRLAAVAAAAALHGSVPLTLELPAGAGSVPVVLPTIGTATFPDGSGAVTFRSTGTEAELVAGAAIVRVPREVRSDAEGWRGARLISTGYRGMRLMLTVEGLDWLPARDRADRFGAPLTAAACGHLVTGWRLLARHHGGVAAEVAAATSMVAPLAAARSRRHSVTFRAAFGCVAMTVPDDPAWVALTLAHEVQHAKLSVVTDVVRLIEPGDGRFYAPWRPDARPAESLLQGIYAHLGVAGFWRRQRRREADADRRLHAETEFVHWLHACLEAAATLRNGGRLTPAGDRFVATMECTLRRWDTEDVSPAAVAAARATTEEHRAQWRLGQPDRAPAAVPDR